MFDHTSATFDYARLRSSILILVHVADVYVRWGLYNVQGHLYRDSWPFMLVREVWPDFIGEIKHLGEALRLKIWERSKKPKARMSIPGNQKPTSSCDNPLANLRRVQGVHGIPSSHKCQPWTTSPSFRSKNLALKTWAQCWKLSVVYLFSKHRVKAQGWVI